ncbi:DUF4355 domain-containing protein [Clostridium botulinum]|nr:DUF4355 domain-containing protein [Clostridium botulinum]NFS52946.1 DUF4355 domain-containing protein [Clostridium botulinum]NFT16468.1 DUF4355 domain-containing protein [Clostridium botulinum]
MDIKEIQEFLNTNKENEEVKDLIKSFQTPITREVVETWCQNGDGRSWLDRNCDIYSSKAVNTAREKAIAKFKEEELPNILETELKKKSNDGLTEDQIALKEMQKQIEEMKAEKIKAENVAKYTKVLGEKKLPTELVDYILADDEEIINKNIDFFSNLITNSVNSSVKERLNNLDETPPKSDELTQEQLINQQLQQAMGIK